MNCAAVPAELVESELFGHEKGAFSGAVSQRRGRFEQADGGTLFLDEIGGHAAGHAGQAAPRPAGRRGSRAWAGTGEIKVDVRLISATNQDIDALLREGRFRQDLYYRISTVAAKVPPLRDRAADVPALAEHFAQAASRRNHWKPRSLTREAVDLLAGQPWKGNVRELRNVVERALILSASDPPRRGRHPGCAPPRPQSRARKRSPPRARCATCRRAYERQVIRERLRQSSGHVTNAARSLGLERSHLYKKCKQLGIDMREET
jgi:transcriptional regulator with GAF, ATPase, and Fis domain